MIYGSNSYTSRENGVSETHREAVANGERTKKRGGMLNGLFSTSIKPIIFKAIYDIINQIATTTLLNNGATPPIQNNTQSRGVAYRAFFGSNQQNNTMYVFDEVEFNDISKAATVRQAMIDILESKGCVSVADYYELSGSKGNYQDNAYGWTDLSDSAIVMKFNGKYVITLKRAVPIERGGNNDKSSMQRL